MSEASRQLCTFRVDKIRLGIDVRQVQEVIRYQAMTRVPLASESICGLINLRGQIVTAIDLRERIDLPCRDPDQQTMNVIVRTDDGVASLLVDEIGDVIDVDSADFEPPPSTLHGPARELVEGAFKLPTGLVLVLNTRQAIDVPQHEPPSI
jgi:purine-binding chemotaxis protein CheW